MIQKNTREMMMYRLRHLWPIELKGEFENPRIRQAIHYVPHADRSFEERIRQISSLLIRSKIHQLAKQILRNLWKPQDTYRYLISSNLVALVNQPIHHTNLLEWQLEEQFEEKKIHLSLKDQIWILLRSLFLSILAIQDVATFSYKLKKKYGVPFFSNMGFFLLSFLEGKITENKVVRSLLKISMWSPKVGAFIGFEHGPTGEAIVDMARRTEADAVFIQHGLQHTNLYPSPYSYFYQKYSWDALYFSYFYPRTPYKVLASQPLKGVTVQEKIALFALEYATPDLSEDNMLSYWKSALNFFLRENWKVVLRPHPRESSFWYSSLLEEPNVFLDQNYKKPFFESVKTQKPLMIVSLTSASLFDLDSDKILTAYLESPHTDRIFAPFGELLCLDMSNETLRLLQLPVDDLKSLAAVNHVGRASESKGVRAFV